MHFLLGSKTEGRREIRPLFICPQSPGLGGCPLLQQRMHFSVWWWFKCPIFYLILMAGKRYAAVTWYCFFSWAQFFWGRGLFFCHACELVWKWQMDPILHGKRRTQPKKTFKICHQSKTAPCCSRPGKKRGSRKKGNWNYTIVPGRTGFVS